MRLILISLQLFNVWLHSNDSWNKGKSAFLKGDYENAIIYFMPYAKDGDKKAQLLVTGQSFHSKKYKEAFKWYELSANQGNARAQYEISTLFK